MISKFRAFYKPFNKYKRLANLNFDNRKQELASVTLWNDGDFDEGERVRPVPTDTVELEQFTGLLDRNGKEIYEGDIVKDSNGVKCSVKWNVKEAHFGFYTGKQMELTDFVWMSGEDLEVVGNIHEEKK